MAEAPAPKRPRRRLRARVLLQASAVAVVVLLLALLVQSTLANQAGPNLVSDIKAGTRPLAPPFELPVIWPRAETWPPKMRRALADRRVSLQELRGHPVVMNFWASWCGPCKDEAPRLNDAAKTHARRVVFLGVDVQDLESDALRFLERYGTNYVSVRDERNSTYGSYGLTGLPETYFLDRRGRVMAHWIGEISEAELEAGVAAAIEEEARSG
jgi:cytochrome c biogenesis protein CcmG/thiol:disulfide interchange protein DsbE